MIHMKCVKCGAEMKEGCVYCSVCGHESKIEADYSVLEDDYLRSLLAAEGAFPAGGKPKSGTSKKTGTDGKAKAGSASGHKKKKKSNKLPIVIVCVLLVAAIGAGIAVKLSIDKKNANSYEYQVNMAQKEAFSQTYEKAIDYYENALALRPGDISVRMAMAELYKNGGQNDAALVVLQEVIDLDASNKKAYRELIAIYEERRDYDSIVALSDKVKDIALLELFEDYIVSPPIISPLGNTFDLDIEITLHSIEDLAIYYTLDGTEPDQTNGILYDSKEGITIKEEGRYELRAVCYNEKGIVSETAFETYELAFVAPDYPTVTPDGGRVEPGSLVTIQAGAFCSIYYTWDNTDPTAASAKYEAPLEIPEGKSVLSVLVVDERTGLDSGIYRTSFTRD